jgi:hypothetical protein
MFKNKDLEMGASQKEILTKSADLSFLYGF